MRSSFKDDFKETIKECFWDLQRINPNCWSLSQIEGKDALAITVHKGDREERGNDGKMTERSEFSETQAEWVSTGTSVWYGFDVLFPKDFLINDNRLVFAQWKQNTGRSESPFLSFRYRNGKFIVQVIYDEERIKFEKRIDLRGSYHSFVVNYRLDKEETGFVKVWMDNELLVDYKGKMGFPSPREVTYFKMGLYRDQIKEDQTIYFSKFKRSAKKMSII